MNTSAFQTDQNGDYAEMRLGETLDFTNDWTDFLAQSGSDTIAASGSVWAVPAGVTVSTPAISGTKTYAFFTPTVVGIYQIDNTLTTTGGRIKKESFRIICKD